MAPGEFAAKAQLSARALGTRLWLYGITVAIAAGLVLASITPWPVSTARRAMLESTMSVLDQGGPPLLAMTSSGNGYSYFPAGGGDDSGVFLFAPLISSTFGLGTTDGLEVLCILLFCVAIAAYPYVFYKLFGSVRSAAVAPIALALAVLAVVGVADIYWAPAWAVLALGPPLLLVTRRPTRSTIAGLILLAIAASLATSLRNHAGLPIVLGALLAASRLQARARLRIGVAAMVVIAYLSVTPGLIRGVEAYRDSQTAGASIVALPSVHLFWHPTYLGVGFLPNRFGIRWLDSVAIARARDKDPSAQYPSAAYDGVVRAMFFDAVSAAPAEIAGVEARKLVVVVALAPFVAAFAVIGLWLLITGGGPAARVRRSLPLLAAAPLIGAASALVGVPDHEFATGFVGSCALLCILGVALLAADGAASARQIVRTGLQSKLGVTMMLVGALMVLGCTLAAPSIRADCRAWQRSLATACGGLEYPPAVPWRL